MDSGDILYVSELLSIDRQGMQSLVSMLDESNFFSARLDHSDPGEGSLANHCLWVMILCQDTLEYALTRNTHIPETMRESVVITSLLHRIHQCHFRQVASSESAAAKTMAIVKKSGLVLLDCERDVLGSDSPLQGESIDSRNPSQVLAYILSGAKKNALDYAPGIPVSVRPLDAVMPKPRNETSCVYLDEEDHRLWANVSLPEFKSFEHADVKDFFRVGTTCVVPLSINGDDSQTDCAVVCDESGMMAFLSKYSIEDDGTVFMNSDRICFGYSDIVLFLSRYPQYRPSYVLAQRSDGKWGAFSIKVSGKKRVPVVDVVPLVRHEFRNRDAAIRAMKTRAGYPARVRHHLFYNEISVIDCFLAD